MCPWSRAATTMEVLGVSMPCGHHLGEDRQRNLLRRPCADAQTYRSVDARDLLIRHSGLAQAHVALLAGATAADRANEAGGRFECHFEGGHVELVVVCQYGYGRRTRQR